MVTLGHCPSRLWAKSLRAIRWTRQSDIEHYFLYHYYPVREASNRLELKALNAEYSVKTLFPGKNLGLHGGLNWLVKELNLQPTDVMIIVDPDTCPTVPGWDTALLKVVTNTEYGWACLTNTATPTEIKVRPGGYTERNIKGVTVYDMKAPCVVSISAVQLDWVFAAGGFHEPCGFYGHIETAMFPDLKKAGRGLAVLKYYLEDDSIKIDQDSIYAAWKKAHAFDGYLSNFREFVTERNPHLLS